uniref:bis(5'-nucleosyl)-tetraphosphatase (symmetrical) YqeK n=1 Tax=Acetatifactor sp. TaxID=1872090 RepID=UPI0040565E2E
MKPNELSKIRKAMEKSLEPKRYEHTLGVEYTAAALAMRYNAPIQSAQLAGLLHDCAKCLSNSKKLSICEKNEIYVSDVEMKNPCLLHAKVGGFLARNEYGVEDQDVLNAILNHNTGRPGMSLLEKIIFVADYIEPGRKQAPNLQEIRRLAFINLDQALIKILEDTLVYLQETGDVIDPITAKTYEYYCMEIDDKKGE